MRNNGKVPPTVRELMSIVSRLRGDEFCLTIKEVSVAIGQGIGTVQKLSILARLHPQVQAMLDDSSEENADGVDPDEPKKDRSRKLTSQLALLLADFSPEVQLEKAEVIVVNRMGFKEARRFVLNERREAGLRVAGGKKGKQGRWFEALSTLARESTQAFGVYTDMTPKEIVAMVANCSPEDRGKVVGELKLLASCLNDIAQKIELKKA